MADPADDLRLDIPGDPRFLGTARLFAAVAGVLLGVPPEGLDDLKLAVSESATIAMDEGAQVIRVQLRRSGRVVECTVTGTSIVGEAMGATGRTEAEVPAPQERAALAMDVLVGLFPDAALRRVADALEVSFSTATQLPPLGQGARNPIRAWEPSQ